MHFGRLNNLADVDFTIPPDNVRTERFLNMRRSHEARIYVGCPIWAAKSWVGTFYPKGTKANEFLGLYARRFKAVEVNSTFYHLLGADRLAAWSEEVTDDFRFCPKVYRGITENLAAGDMSDLVARFCEALRALGRHLGLAFAQFPESLGPRQAPLLSKFIATWPSDVPLAVELRHPGWFHDHALHDETVNFFYRHKVATVITDTPGRRDVLHTSLTQPRVIIRFQGNELDSTDRERLDFWAERLASWRGKNLEDVYFFTHQPADEVIHKTAEFFIEELARRDMAAVQGSAPKSLGRDFPLFPE